MSSFGTIATSVLALAASASVIAAQQPEKDRQTPPGQQQQERPGGAEPRRQQPDQTRQPAASDKQAEPRQPAAKDRQAEPTQPAAKDRQAEPRQPAAKDRQAEPTQPGANRQAEPKQSGNANQAAGRNQAGRVQISDEQRTRIRQSFGAARSERVTNAKFTVVVGTRVPRTVRFYPLPATVFEIVPEYRGYEYIVVDERITIVDPRSRVIVAVIDDGGRRASGQQIALELTPEQLRFIHESIDRNQHRADVRVRLALGAEVPRTVELYAFPDVVVSRVPQLSQYRFIVVDDQVVVVDPRDREVALVINR